MKTESKDLLSKMDSFFAKHQKYILWLTLLIGAVMSILMFDCKVSLSGDDCDYIVNAQNFIKHFTYPAGRGSLYPIIISPFLINGINLILLKSLSAIFILLSIWLTYKSFCDKIPASILMPALLIISICPYIFFYASYTYSEPFFMLTQSLFIYLFFKYFYNNRQPSSLSIKKDWRKYLFLGLCMLAMGLTRTIGFAVIGVVIIYFCFQKQWKNILYTTSTFIIVFVVFSIIKNIVWPESGAAYDINNYLAKNFYNIEQGMEDFPGYINRIVINSNIYLSCFFYQYLGLIPISESPFEGPSALSIFTYLLFIVCIVAVFNKNKTLFFTGLYVGIMNFTSFILLQTTWAQDRLIMIYYPLMLIFILGGLYYLIKNKKLSWIYPIILIILFIGTSIHTKGKLQKNIPILQQNILGSDLYGLTPDWENFIKMSRWANDNLDKNAVIASRKPTISYAYTGRDFFGIYNAPHVAISDILKRYHEEKEENIYLTVEVTQNSPNLKTLEPFLQYVFTTKSGGSFLINDKKITFAFVFKIEKSLITEDLINYLNTNNINYSINFDVFIKQYSDDKNILYQIIDPDILLQLITENNIRYFILAKIRLYTAQNTGQYINTIHQYLSYIQFKYPNRFKLIHNIGKEENCELAEFIAD